MGLVLPGGKLGPVDRLGGLVVIAPAQSAGDPDSNPGPGEKSFSLKLLTAKHAYTSEQDSLKFTMNNINLLRHNHLSSSHHQNPPYPLLLTPSSIPHIFCLYFSCVTLLEILNLCPVLHGAMGCGQKSFKLVWQCHHPEIS